MSKATKIRDSKKVIFNDLRLSDNTLVDVSNKELDNLLFYNPYTLRLNKKGRDTLKKYYKSYSFRLEKKFLTGKELLTIRQNIPYPFYLSASEICLFSSKESFMLSLSGGDISTWIKGILKLKQNQ